jgi:hypothetical protein
MTGDLGRARISYWFRPTNADDHGDRVVDLMLSTGSPRSPVDRIVIRAAGMSAERRAIGGKRFDFRAPAQRLATRRFRSSCRVIRRAIDRDRLIAVAAEPSGEPAMRKRRSVGGCCTTTAPQSHQANQPRRVTLLRHQRSRITLGLTGRRPEGLAFTNRLIRRSRSTRGSSSVGSQTAASR